MAVQTVCHSETEASTAGPWRFWKSSDGMGESESKALTCGPDGTLIVQHGESESITLFDGYTFRLLPNPGPWFRVHQNTAGHLWAVYEEGLQQFVYDQWKRYPLTEIRDAKSIPDIAPVGKDDIYILLPEKLVKYHIPTRSTSVIQSAAESRIGPFVSMIPARDGGVWIGGREGAARIAGVTPEPEGNAAWQEYPCQSISVQDIRQLQEGDDRGLFAVARDLEQGQPVLAYLHRGEWTILNRLHPKIERGWGTNPNDYWLQEDRKFYHSVHQQEQPVDAQGSLSSVIHDIVNRENGAFWAATSEGIVRHTPPLWQRPFPERPPEFAHSLYEDAQGRIWIACIDALNCLTPEGEWKNYPIPDRLRMPEFLSDALWMQPDGRLALCSLSDHLVLFDPAEEEFIEVPHPESRIVGPFHARRAGGLWLQTFRKGTADFRLEIYDGNRFRPYLDLGGSWGIGELRSLCETESGDLWLIGTRGLSRYQGSTYHIFGPEDGYRGRGGMALCEVKPGVMWIGGRRYLWEYDGKHFSVRHEGMETIRSIIRDASGMPWIGSGSGVTRRFDRGMLRNDEAEGLPSSVVYDLLEDSRHRIWAGTTLGVALFHPQVDRDPPETTINPELNSYQVSPEGEAQFSVVGVDRWKNTVIDRLSFHYRIDRGSWQSVSRTGMAGVKGLAAGDHLFEVQGSDRNGNVDATPAVFPFTVPLPWYAHGGFLFIVSCSLLLIAFLLALAFNYHLRQERVIAYRTEKLTEANRLLKEDIVNRKHAQEEKTKLENQLRHAQKMEALGRLAGGIAHDFNNLLTVINGHSTLMVPHTQPDTPLRRHVEEIRKAVERASSLTGQLLLYSRKRILEISPLEIRAILLDMESLLCRLLGEDIELHIHAPHDLGWIKSDKSGIEQVVMNLAVNARDAMPRGGRLVIEAQNVNVEGPVSDKNADVKPGEYVLLTFTDTGTGMDSQTLARIFEPFFTTKDYGKGTGLGLSTVYGIVKQSGGHIGCESEPGAGAAFKIYFQRYARSELVLEQNTQKLLATTVAPLNGKETLFVVEDEEPLRLLARDILELDGYRVIDAPNGSEALTKAKESDRPIHLLITDVIMPVMGGPEVAQRLAEMHPETKVLFISGYTDTAITDSGTVEAGVYFLAKPFTPDQLTQKVREILG